MKEKEETGYFSSLDGTKLFYRAWDKDVPDVLVIVHGFGEHSGRYLNLIESIGSQPYSIYVHDLRGHGHSEGPKVYVDRFIDYVNDVILFTDFIHII